MKCGKFITFEGPEGAGKSTQVRMLGAFLERSGIACVITREPGGTPLAEELRSIVKGFSGSETVHPETELLLMEAARAQHAGEVIAPALAQGKWVLCDRFFDSTTAYQGGARGIDRTIIDTLNRFAAKSCIPDLTVLMDLAPEAGFARAAVRQETQGEHDRFELEKIDFHHKVRNAFLACAAAEPQRFRVVNADRSIEEIHREIVEIVTKSLQ
ncbi:MAG: dTMP kinase [Lentisphaeria bacterium]|jgi:dTMP kinase|nr:dTMP kinase [Lentisphaeria bacterium]